MKVLITVTQLFFKDKYHLQQNIQILLVERLLDYHRKEFFHGEKLDTG